MMGEGSKKERKRKRSTIRRKGFRKYSREDVFIRRRKSSLRGQYLSSMRDSLAWCLAVLEAVFVTIPIANERGLP